ncbi:MAG: N-6 DNA methylase [Chloroflexi bacterium]|nr:N-6 DNA methylase [Chloroflexota bacterium]
MSGQDYYRQLLRVVYRLLFLFVAEDRDLLLQPNPTNDPTLTAARERYGKYYSTQRLRQMAETFKGTRHPDLYEGLRLVMRLLSGDPPADGTRLALVPLGSFLFSDRAMPDVIDCQISNQHLLDAIRALSLTYDARAQVYRSIDYRNLGPEELGSIYESLLELHPQINVAARQFALATAGGNERKTTGSYYTPTSLINALLDSALDPVLNEAIRQPHPPTPSPKGEGELSAEQRILNLKICDPACGSGHFLIAAAGRMAKKLAEIRTGEEEPPPSAIQEAKRDIISHCIYGVDINPMAVELCKVNLWMEALEPGKPLSFLDHRILVGNSLLGTTPALMAGGIPDDAFNPIEGDDKADAAWLKKLNKQERKARESGQRSMFEDMEPPADYRAISAAVRQLDSIDDDTLDGLRRKEQAYAALEGDPERRKAQILADAWCAAFVWDKGASNQLPPMSDLYYRNLQKAPLDTRYEHVRRYVQTLQRRYQFFHWHVAFPDVFAVPEDVQGVDNAQTGWNGGFDCVLGNPPWERITLKEKEWFEKRIPEVAATPNPADRKRLIRKLQQHSPVLFDEFKLALRQAVGEKQFVRNSNRYPLCGRGDVNTYALFSEASYQILSGDGFVGLIVPSGIATDDTTKFYFQYLMETHLLISLYDFENREAIFASVHRGFKFCLLTLSGNPKSVRAEAEFVFYAQSTDDLSIPEKRVSLSLSDIMLLNPNSRTTATFRYRRDAELTKAIYHRIPILLAEHGTYRITWNVSLARMLHMGDDAELFRTQDDLENRGATLEQNNYRIGEEVYTPLYEGKMFMPFDHRYASVIVTDNVERPGQQEFTSMDEHMNPKYSAIPRFWIPLQEVQDRLASASSRNWLIAIKKVTAPTNERTFLSSILPLVAVGDSAFLVIADSTNSQSALLVCLFTNMSTFVLDYIARQKMGNVNLNYYIVEQLPFVSPDTYTTQIVAFILLRAIELTYTAWDMQPFAQDVGYHGAPFVWDEERRFVMRCELDALYFHLYGINREDAEYILETFPIVKRKDIAAHGDYRTQRVILEMYDQMAALPKISVPAPKDAHATYPVPDVSQWVSPLNPPPGDVRAAHRSGDS